MLTEEQTRISDFVYRHLVQLYSKFAMDVFEYLTPELAQIISYTAYAEMIQMAQNRNLNEYYKRIIRGAV